MRVWSYAFYWFIFGLRAERKTADAMIIAPRIANIAATVRRTTMLSMVRRRCCWVGETTVMCSARSIGYGLFVCFHNSTGVDRALPSVGTVKLMSSSIIDWLVGTITSL